nr:EAL domain-containing protein [Providencia huaxiensis]
MSKNELHKHTDITMNQAKDQDTNSLFDLASEQSTFQRNLLIADLHMALIHNEFQLYYQALVDQQQTIIGYEALLRWHHPQRGLVLPNDFISIAEQSHLIYAIGERTLELACQQLRLWCTDSISATWTISINISIEQFQNKNFEKNLIQVTKKYGVSPKLLRLELTESMHHLDLEQSILTMDALIEQGFSFSLDDFGTGYSSFYYLKTLPFQQLKIDKSFIENIAHTPQDLAIAQTIIELAKILNLTVVGEGIETEEQFLILKAQGCNIFQGYYIGYPQPLEKHKKRTLLNNDLD